MMLSRQTLMLGVMVAAAVSPARAQTAQAADRAGGQAATIEEMVVTATKRSESASHVPMSITALSGDQLRDLGVTQVSDLAKVTPGLQYTPTTYGTAVYTIRGVGFNESSLGATPTVSVYVDEAPLPFGNMTPIATLDIQRVEVLKGPQGTLFGQNSTGGAINFIAAKPTNTFESGTDLTLDRFGGFEGSGFVSGPISDTLGYRVALKTNQGGAWQKSYTTGAKLGDANALYGRVILEWTPADAVKVSLNLNHFYDRSEIQAPQFAYLTPLNEPVLMSHTPALFTYPTAPHNDRAADWTPADKPENDNRQTQGVLRADIDLSDSLTFTSLTDYAKFKEDQTVDSDGVSLQDYAVRIHGDIKSFSQELRLTGNAGQDVRYIVGANYAYNRVLQSNLASYPDNSNSLALQAFGGAYNDNIDRSLQKTHTKAAFGNVDYTFVDNLTAHVGLRYTEHDIDFSGCTADGGDNQLAPLFTAFADYLRSFSGLSPITPVAPGGCVTLDANNVPGEVANTFNERNISWRAGLDWQVEPSTMLYANISRGYKSGSFPLLPASIDNQLTPVKQESVLAYEAGFKTTLLERTMSLNGALFYYDYKDKQLRVQTDVPIFGQLERLVNIPKSHIQGGELQLSWVPVAGLTINGGATYIDSKVDKGVGNVYTIFGDPLELKGESFPLTPKWQVTADVTYDWPVSAGMDAFVGTSGNYQSSTYGEFGREYQLSIDSYSLLNLQAGLRSDDNSWRVSLWGRNVTNRYYWNNAYRVGDTTVRLTGRPATYGVTLSLRYF